MSGTYTLSLSVNGEEITCAIDPRRNLVDFLREDLQLTGTHVGCEHGVCGACTLRVNGEIVRGCLMLAVQAEGAKVETIEGVSDSGEIADLQEEFHKRNAPQCGFCTPGFLMLATGVLEKQPNISDTELRHVLSSNLCRCTGYQNILEAVKATRTLMKS